jgi:CO/xanthine dehydrogenase Mo-binding subunit
MRENISRPFPGVESTEKSGGYAAYIADMKFKGMLHAKTLRSTEPKAKIKDITFPHVPDGYWIIDRHDVPGMNRVKMVFDDQPFFAEDSVNYIGEPILLVVGPEKEKIFEILSSIRVSYEPLKPVFSIEESERSFCDYKIKKGYPEEAFRNAARIVEDEYRTGLQEHVYLEPQGMIGIYENKRVTVFGSMQCPYYIKNALIQGLGWSEERIRVVQATTGGAFGGKEEYPSLIAGHVAFAAVKTGKPVSLIFDRSEDIRVTTKRHPSIIKIKTALDEKNSITALNIDIRLDGGAYAGLSNVVLQRAMFVSTGVYNIPNAQITGRALATNNVPTGALRGFGGPQALFAIEMHMNRLAMELKSDPLDFKKQYLLKKGNLTVTGGVLRDEIKLDEIAEKIEEISGYRKKSKEYARGIGLSFFLHGCAFTGSGERDLIRAKVKLRKKKDGKVEILVANVDMGQGPKTTLRKIVARSLGLPIEDVIYENPDTDRVPDSGPTVASRTVMIVGGLLQKAAVDLLNSGDDASDLEVVKEYVQPDYIRWDQETFQGNAYPVYSWGANVVEVEADPVTFEIKVHGIWGVYDIGTAIDEKIIQGQIEGGIIQGLGYAGIEVMNTRNGKILQDSMTDYIIPTSVDTPEIKARLVHNPYEFGPFGAKCAGEVPLIGVAPAFAAAVQNSLGVPIKRIPVNPEYILEVMEGAPSLHSQ